MAGMHHHGHAHFHRHADAGHGVSVEPAAEAVPLTVARVASPVQGVEQPTGQLLSRAVGDKPVGPDTTNIVIACSIVIPLVVAITVLLFLHRRSVKRQRLEDSNDKYKSMDFGLGDGAGGPKNGKRRSAFFGKEKGDPSHKTQLSMDMNLSSPYLLPPTLQHSRESLARSLNKDESDPYRLVTDYVSEVGSMRSFPNKRPDRGSSIYSGKTGATRPSSDAPSHNFPPRQKSLPPPTSPLPQLPPSAQRAVIVNPAAPSLPVKNEFRFNDDEPSRPPTMSQTIPEDRVPEIQVPPQAATESSVRSPRTSSGQQPLEDRGAYDRESGPLPPREASRGQGLGITGAAAPYPQGDNMPVIVTESQPASNGFDFDLKSRSPQQGADIAHQEANLYPEENDYPHSAGLAVPETANKRLSVGFRPLPPDDYLESEDPEFRANRIRSFYKEYFDDSIKQDSGRPPPLPQQRNAGPQQGAHEEPGYYEDYDAGYMGGEAAYFDPETNAFVMPYAQPVTRRAMTPPPSNRRPMPGPRNGGPHRGPQMPGGPQGRARAGSTMSGAGPMGRPRAGSTMSGGRFGPGPSGYMSPRPGSSASQQRSVNGGKPKKPMPPPAALTTLPTPSKLKDDNFGMINAADFAPPPTIRDQVRGRSQSPLGERRPYLSPSVPAHSPLVSAYDEVAALPSPHSMRKSSTFTGLDFAPPRRFRDADNMSDAGSIRSNNSGISSRNAHALRNGAGRVSRLPGDTVFTQHEMTASLRPTMDMTHR